MKRDDLLQHQQTLDQIIQKYNLIPTNLSTSNSRCLSLFLSIAQIFKSNNPTNDILDIIGLSNQIRDAVYQQLKSNFDQYNKYILNKPTNFDIRRDSQWIIESNYYRCQLERALLFALAHVLQCNLYIFSSLSSQQQHPEMITIDNRINDNDHVIVLLKNESTQRFTSARITCKNSMKSLIFFFS